MLVLSAILALPLILWLALPDRWQPALPWIVLCVLIAALVTAAAKVAADRSRAQRNPSRPDCHWHEHFRAQEFSSRLTIFLRERGWRVTADLLDARRIQVAIEKDRRYALLLCVAPGAEVTQADIARVASWRAASAGRIGAIICNAKRPDSLVLSPKDSEIFFLQYEEIEDLDMLFWTGG